MLSYLTTASDGSHAVVCQQAQEPASIITPPRECQPQEPPMRLPDLCPVLLPSIQASAWQLVMRQMSSITAGLSRVTFIEECSVQAP